MTRSEEQLRVGTETREAGRARLRKHVVTEHQQVTVPVSHEEVTLEREPITEANRGAAYDGPAISEEEHEVTLHAERPVVDTEAVAGRAGAAGQGDRHRPGDRRRRGPQGGDRARPRRHQRPRRRAGWPFLTSRRRRAGEQRTAHRRRAVRAVSAVRRGCAASVLAWRWWGGRVGR